MEGHKCACDVAMRSGTSEKLCFPVSKNVQQVAFQLVCTSEVQQNRSTSR